LLSPGGGRNLAVAWFCARDARFLLTLPSVRAGRLANYFDGLVKRSH